MAKKEDLYRAFRLKMVRDIVGGRKKNWLIVSIGVGVVILGIYFYLNPNILVVLLEKIGINLLGD